MSWRVELEGIERRLAARHARGEISDEGVASWHRVNRLRVRAILATEQRRLDEHFRERMTHHAAKWDHDHGPLVGWMPYEATRPEWRDMFGTPVVVDFEYAGELFGGAQATRAPSVVDA